MNKYDVAYMNCAEAFAQCSTSTRLKVGCVIVQDNNIVAEGLNGTPPGHLTNKCEDTSAKTSRDVVHSEMNAICKAAREGHSTKGATLYVTHSPCPDCVKHIVSAGINKVVFKHIYAPKDSKSDGNEGIRLLFEMNVEVKQLC